MSGPTNSDNPRRQQIDKVIGAFLVALDSGQNPDPDEWLARHPDLCPELAEFFADRARLDDLFGPLRTPPSKQSADPAFSVTTMQGGSDGSSPQTMPRDPEDGIPTQTLPEGSRVRYFGDYELQKVLGEGGMGIVYKARQISLNRPVALKMIRAARFASTDEVRRFQNEAEAVARLDHPNIVPIFEVGRFEDQHYFSMKLIGGESLDKRLKDYVADPRRAARLVAVAAAAVHHAHQRGILHRDLKPANILVDADGSPHVTDFGLAKRVEGDSELTQSGAILGTPAYMAPEQASGKRGAVTTSTDVYGLGAILYALSTGRAPFGGGSVAETLEHVRERPPHSPRRLNPRLSRDLEVICLKCLEKDPRRRYPSADAVAEDLKRWLAGEPISARPVGRAARAWMWCRRNSVVAGTAGLTVASLVVVALLSLLYAGEQARRADEKTRAAETISGLVKNLKTESQSLKTSLGDSNRRLALVSFERSRRAFDGGQISHGLLWLVECQRLAIAAEDRDLQRLARANLCYWRYLCPELKGVLSPANEMLGVIFSPNGKTILTGSVDGVVRIWDATTAKPIGQLLVPGTQVSPRAFSPDGRTVLIVISERTARLWDAVTMQPIGQPMERRGRIWSVAFSPDGKSVVIGSEEKTARLWDAATGLPLGRTFEDQEPILHVAFSPDGKTVLTSGAGNTRLWNAFTARSIGQLTSQNSLAAPLFSPDGRTILTCDAQLWDAATAQPKGEPLRPRVSGPVLPLPFIRAFSPDGKTILTANSDRTAHLWDVATGKPVGQPMVHPGRVSSRAFSPDSTMIVTSSDNKARFWDASTGLPIGHPLPHDAAIQSARFSPNRKTVLTVCEDDTARLWDAATGLPIGQPLDEKHPISRAKYSPDGRAILIESFPDNTARLWDAVALRPIGRWIISPGRVAFATFRPDGKALLTASGNTARQWDAITAQPIGQPYWHQHRLSGATYSPDGRTILTVSFGSTSRLWDAATGRSIGQPLVHEDAIRRVCFSPDGKTVLTGSDDNTARQWNVADAQPIGRPMVHPTALSWVAYSPDGRTVLTSSGGMTRLWDAASGRQMGQPMKHQSVGAAIVQRIGVSLAVSPNGRTILAGGPGNVARLWDATSGEAVGQSLQHTAAVRQVAYSPDGAVLITGSEDGTVRLWDAGTTLPIGHPFQHDSAVRSIACSPDGKSVLTVDSGRARLWRLPIALDDELPRIRAWVETITGLRIDDQGAIRPLDSARWQDRREQLQRLGGQPKSDPGWLFDPILHGLDPTAKARAWSKRKRWTEAEASFDEAVRARPLNGAIRRERGAFFDNRKRTDKADIDFACAYFLGDGLHEMSRELSSGLFSFDYHELGRYINDKVIDHIRNLYPCGAIGPSTELLLSRARQLVKRRQWNEARDILVKSCKLPRGIPEDPKLLQLRGDLFAEMNCWERAEADYGEIIQRWPEQHSIRHRQILSLLVAGDRAGLRRAVTDLLALFGRTTDPGTAQDVAWYCAVVPGDIVDCEIVVRLAELASTDHYDAQARSRPSITFVPNTLGAALYRAGRLEDSILQLEEGIHPRKGTADPADCAYLAMAHYRVGHKVEARRWLDRLKNREPTWGHNQFWEDLEIRLLRSEAEAVILYDPVFPGDPFAH